MDVPKVLNELKKKYPGKKIILNTPEKTEEIVCEIETGAENPDRSVAIAVLDKSILHFHRQAKEVYEVLKGTLEVSKKGRTFTLHEGEKLTVNPGEQHTAKGHETWVKVISEPAWSAQDHLQSAQGT